MAQSTNTTRLDIAQMEALLPEIQAIPDVHDDIDLTTVKQTAQIALQQALTALRILRKMSA